MFILQKLHFFKKSGRFPDSLDEIYAAKASKRDLKASATFFENLHAALVSQVLKKSTFPLKHEA